MKAGKARLYFLGLTLILATLLVLKLISPLASGIIFAAGLLFFGLISGGFRKK